MQYLFTCKLRLATRLFSSLLMVACALITLPAQAASLIRDAEIERTLRLYSDPVFEAAGLTPSSINMYIVQDDTINAFVMGGSNIFLNTGLIMKTEEPGMLIGVIAHETGHIAGGHLVRNASAMEKARLQALISQLLGAAAVASGAGDAGAAIMSAGQHTAMRGMLAYTRGNEQAADQAALTILDKLKISASGMMETFEILRKFETRKVGDPDPYTLTHPLSKDRIMHMRNHVEESTIPAGAVPEGFDVLHERMLGKLEGFLQPPEQVLARYAEDDSLRARYARAIARYRNANTEQAVAEIDALLAEMPDDPYFYELKGQTLFEGGEIERARMAYEKAIELLPDSALIRTELARSLLAEPTPEHVQQAIRHLEFATSADTENPSAWRLLATAYGRHNRLDLSHLALAEEALLLNKPDQAITQLEVARQYIADGSPADLRAGDLQQEAAKRQKENKNNNQS